MAPMKEPMSADVTAALDALVARATHHIVGTAPEAMAIVQEVQAQAALLRRALAATPPTRRLRDCVFEEDPPRRP